VSSGEGRVSLHWDASGGDYGSLPGELPVTYNVCRQGPGEPDYVRINRSAPSGQCGCAVDADCEGGGRCVDGRCSDCYECLESAECGPGQACLRDGPAVLRQGHEVHADVELVLQ